jgi:inosine-uridine nucleoside N-ribohydrolase
MNEVCFHGKNGFGDIEFPMNVDHSLIQSENAISALNRITSDPAYQGKVSLICLAPLTSLALCMRTFPQMAENICQLYVMGGNYTGKSIYFISVASRAKYFILLDQICLTYVWLLCPSQMARYLILMNIYGAKENFH